MLQNTSSSSSSSSSSSFFFFFFFLLLSSSASSQFTNCTYCSEPDSISHTFIGCHHFKTFFQNVLQHFNEENATSFTLSDEELLLGKSLNTIDQLQRSPLLLKLNYCMLLAKYYLFNQKHNQIEPELNEFKNRLNLQYHVEKLV